jgi:hypothetical protein
VVRARHHRKGHRDRHCDGEDAQSQMAEGDGQDDADEQVPPEMQARERRVLIGEPGGLERR